MPDSVEYVQKQAAKVTPAAVKGLLAKLPFLKAEFTQIASPKYPNLFEQLEFLAGLVEDFAEGADGQIPYVVAAEAAFALFYVHRHVEQAGLGSPDGLPTEADDSTIVRALSSS
ncbi:MAG TPA: hypothetical protein VIM58_05395 [Candidatus Methylacidiphilales bacterium]